MLVEKYTYESFYDAGLTDTEMEAVHVLVQKQAEHQRVCPCEKGDSWLLTHPYEVEMQSGDSAEVESTVVISYHPTGNRVVVVRRWDSGGDGVGQGVVCGQLVTTLVEVDEEYNELPPADDGSKAIGDES